MKNEELIKEYITTRDLSYTTYTILKTALNNYSKYQQLTLQELIDEAENEEENNIRWKKRTLKKRLINYTNHLKKTKNINTVKSYVSMVKSFYYHHEIEIHHLPPVNKKNMELENPITYKDLPDKDIIRVACEISKPVMRTLFLFLSSSGMSKIDALNLTVEDFMIATKQYHDETEIISCLKKLNELSDVVPTWRLRRQKTNKYFVTFNTPEATMEIVNYLLIRNQRKTLMKSDKLFKVHKDYYSKMFIRVNDMLQLKKVGSFNRFRGHMLRKFHASNLEKDGMNRYQINVLQGKSNGAVDDVYFFEDEDKLREEYIQHMHCLLIFTKVKEVEVYSPEYLKVLKENERLKLQSDKISQMEADVQRLMEWYQWD